MRRHVAVRDRWKRRNPFLIGGAAVLGVTALASGARRAAERRRRIERCELRELSDSWTWIGAERWYVRVSVELHRHQSRSSPY